MAITFDGATKRIILDSADVSIADIWSRWVDWHVLNPQWPLAFSLVGGISLGSGLSIPPYFFLLNSWRVRPMEGSHNLTLTGNLFVEGGGVPVVNTLGTFQVNVNYTVPVQAQGINTSGGSLTAADVWAYINRTLTSGGSGVSAADIWAYNNRTLTAIDTATIADAVDAVLSASFAALPTALETAIAIRDELSVELARIDAAISSRHVSNALIPANIKQINNTVVNGSGTDGDPWR